MSRVVPNHSLWLRQSQNEWGGLSRKYGEGKTGQDGAGGKGGPLEKSVSGHAWVLLGEVSVQ